MKKLILLILILLVACNVPPTPTPTAPPTETLTVTPEPTLTDTPMPTVTLEPTVCVPFSDIDWGQTVICVEGTGVLTVQKNNVTITGKAGGIYISYKSNVTIQDMELTPTGRGIFVQESNNISLLRNTITIGQSSQQTDGIYSQRNHDNHYLDNTIIIQNEDADGHNDGIQSYQDTNLTIDGNYIHLDNHKETNSQGIYITQANGIMQVSNNEVVGLFTKNSLLALRNLDAAYTGKLVAGSNILEGGCWGVLRSSDSRAIIRQNTIISTRPGCWAVRIDGLLPEEVQCNQYDVDILATIEGSSVSLSRWNDLGFDTDVCN